MLYEINLNLRYLWSIQLELSRKTNNMKPGHGMFIIPNMGTRALNLVLSSSSSSSSSHHY